MNARDAAGSYQAAMAGWVEAINRQDVDAMVSFFTEDVQFEDVAMQRVCHSRQELRALLKEWMRVYPGTSAELVSVHASEDSGFTEWVLTVPHPPESEGKTGDGSVGGGTRLRGACVDQFQPDGRIYRHRDYWNTADLAAP